MPSGHYDRTKYEKACEYCEKTFVLTTKQWNAHVTKHLQKGDLKHNPTVVLNGSRTTVNENGKNPPNIPSTTALLPPNTCGECLEKGVTRTFDTAIALGLHRSHKHGIRGPNYKYQHKYRLQARKQKRGTVSVAHRGDTNGNETFDDQAAQRAADEDRITYFVAGHASARIEVFATSLGQSAAILTERVLSVLTMGINPSREELRSKGKVSNMRRAPSA